MNKAQYLLRKLNLPEGELRDMASFGAEHQVEVSLFVGLRTNWEGSGPPLISAEQRAAGEPPWPHS